MKTLQYLDTVKRRHGWTSDYKLAKELDISRSRMSSYRTGRTEMDDDMCLKVEKLLNLPTGTVLLDIQSQRTKCPDAARIMRALSRKIADSATNTVYYVKYMTRDISLFFPPLLFFFRILGYYQQILETINCVRTKGLAA